MSLTDSPALALLCALVKAKIAQAESQTTDKQDGKEG